MTVEESLYALGGNAIPRNPFWQVKVFSPALLGSSLAPHEKTFRSSLHPNPMMKGSGSSMIWLILAPDGHDSPVVVLVFMVPGPSLGDDVGYVLGAG